MLYLIYFYCFCSHFFFFKQKTAYEMRISDWSSDVCSSDLRPQRAEQLPVRRRRASERGGAAGDRAACPGHARGPAPDRGAAAFGGDHRARARGHRRDARVRRAGRSEEHTSELQSLMRISYDVFCLKKKNYFNSQAHMYTYT